MFRIRKYSLTGMNNNLKTGIISYVEFVTKSIDIHFQFYPLSRRQIVNSPFDVISATVVGEFGDKGRVISSGIWVGRIPSYHRADAEILFGTRGEVVTVTKVYRTRTTER